eukprot:TRINITY_DN101370_c0_g1_i1.p1 TRINITY_DN101370_c0_g1~~TRINITY_DN101370_c0_g1_i1.p1  ORF type:complete len:156 (-),score=17.75 TRINITY_DN101370_c0_g1_i1:119-586(-)
MSAGFQKQRLNLLFLVHSITAVSVGVLAFLLPHIFGFFLGEEWHGSWRWNPDDNQVRISHVTIRLYGALILGQAIIVWEARKSEDGTFRRALVRAYFVVFTLTFLALARAHFTDTHFHALNYLNLAMFGALAVFYGWFTWFQPPPVFEGLDKAFS